MDSNNFKGIVQLTTEQYKKLSSTGTLSVNTGSSTETLSFDPTSILYVITDGPEFSKNAREVSDSITGSLTFGNNGFQLNDFPILSLTTAAIINVTDVAQEYNFGMRTGADTNINIDCVNCSLPSGFTLEANKEYVCKILNGKICILGKFDA